MEPRDFKGYDHQEQFERAQGLGHGMGGYAGGRAPEEAWGSLGGGYGEQTSLQSGPRSWNVRTATGDPRTRRGPKNYKRSDERIREDVCERLADHEDIDATEIEVRVEGGEVYLSGSVDTRREKHLAEDVAATVMGVTDVTNGLRVARGPSQGGS
jgi:hypothetical protein